MILGGIARVAEVIMTSLNLDFRAGRLEIFLNDFVHSYIDLDLGLESSNYWSLVFKILRLWLYL